MELISIIAICFIIVLINALFTGLLKNKGQDILLFLTLLTGIILTSIPSITAITGHPIAEKYLLPHNLGTLNIQMDSLSAWLVLIINFGVLQGSIYGIFYLKSYQLPTNKWIHYMTLPLFHLSMIGVCVFQQGFGFLIAWEVMSLTSMVLVMFEYQKRISIRAALNYLVQMHIGVLLIISAFILLYVNTGSSDFSNIALLNNRHIVLVIFGLFFAGFAIKAGFVPFHTWLPIAHPAAPSHISGMMSGLLVKLGIYGIIRVVLYLPMEYTTIGTFILVLSLITTFFGIANAGLRSDFKRMLAYCTIENVGIIGIGIGIGLIGKGINEHLISWLGFTAALLHILNHSLFKTLLFYSAGSVYRQTHSKNIEHLGGLIKFLPYTAAIFLIGGIAICGIPPFNGFVSKFVLYKSMIEGLSYSNIGFSMLFIISMAVLAISGGISVFTFTKNFGMIFLGNTRKKMEHQPKEVNWTMLLPQFIIIAAMLSIAFFPSFYISMVSDSANRLSTIYNISNSVSACSPHILSNVALCSACFILIIGLIFAIRQALTSKLPETTFETWGCGYTGPAKATQYTGRSFSETLAKLLPIIPSQKLLEPKERKGIYIQKMKFSIRYLDIFDVYIIEPFTNLVNRMISLFRFIQNGQVQLYLLYGILFLLIILIGSFWNIIR